MGAFTAKDAFAEFALDKAVSLDPLLQPPAKQIIGLYNCVFQKMSSDHCETN